MCRAMEELRNESKSEGIFKGKLESVVNLMETLKITVQDALKLLKIPESEHARYIAAIASAE